MHIAYMLCASKVASPRSRRDRARTRETSGTNRPLAPSVGRKRVSGAPVTDERAFLASYDPAAFDRPSVTVDVALLSAFDGSLHTVLVRRREPPFAGRYALPGGFVKMEESLPTAALRVLTQKTGLRRVFLEQLYTFGEPNRDPRTRVVSVAHYALVEPARLQKAAKDNPDTVVASVELTPASDSVERAAVRDSEGTPLSLAFDHAEILATAVRRIRGKLDYTPIGFQLLPDRFTLLDLQRVHETVLGRPLNKDSFRRRMLASGEIEPTGESQTGVDHRPAELFRFVRRSAV